MYKALLILAMTASCLTSMAQSESGLLLEAEAEKKLSKKFSVALEADMRTRNDFKTMDRWSIGIGGEYKPVKHLKLGAGYTLLNTNFREGISYTADGNYNNWRPSYWGVRHRFNVSASGTYKFRNNLRISLRERWQYTYRPEKTVHRWDFDNSWWEEKVRSSKGKSQLRSRLQVEYDKKHALMTPFASVELYNSLAIEKVRYTVGTDLNISKRHTFSVFYRFQDMHNTSSDDYDPDMHYLGAGYKFSF